VSGSAPGPVQRPRSVLRGIALLARGRAAGLAEFGDSRDAFLASLAPLIAFPLVGAGLVVAAGQPAAALADFLATLCALLAPPVLSQLLAVRWGREAAWLRFAVAFNWCQWAIPVAAAALMAAAAVAITFGIPAGAAGAGMVGGLVCYGLWLHWFLARNALSLGAARAALLVLGVNVGTALLVLLPHLLALAVQPQAGEA